MPSESETKAEQRVQELNKIIQTAKPIQPQANPQTPLSAVLADANASWKFSEEGASGAMLVRTQAEATGGTAIKVEDPINARLVQKNAQMMDTFFQKAQGQAPFAAPRVTTYSTEELMQDQKLGEDLTAKLKSLEAVAGDRQPMVASQIGKLKDVSQGLGTVVKMEFASGEPISKIPVEDRVAMLKSDAFVQNMARAMPAFVALGMNDHLGDGAMYKNNLSNMMFDTKTGQLSAIDFSTSKNIDRNLGVNDPDLVEFGQKGGDMFIGDLRNELNRAMKSPESLEAAVDGLVQGNGSQLSGMMDALTKTAYEGSLFHDSEAQIAEQQITPEDRRRVAMNLIKGTLQGLDYIKQNEPALRMATAATHENVKGMQREHFYKGDELDTFCAEVKKVDAQGLIKKMDDMRLEKLQAQSVPLAADLEKATAKLNRLENKPSLADRVKFMTSGKENVINEARAQQASLQAQADSIRKEVNGILNDQKLAEYRTEQAAKPKVDAPPVKLRDNAAMASIAAQHPHHDDPAQAQGNDVEKPKGPGKLRDNAEMAAAIKVFENKMQPAVDAPKAGVGPKPNR